jgi:hypothetical protein
VADEDIILNRHPFANEGMRRNLASAPYECILLNFDESSDYGVVVHRAAIKIHQVRLEDLDSVTQNNVGGNRHEDYSLQRI